MAATSDHGEGAGPSSGLPLARLELLDRRRDVSDSLVEVRHTRLFKSAEALVEAHDHYLRADRGDSEAWDRLQRSEMATRHALEDEASSEHRGVEVVCPCRTCKEIGGVGG